MRYIALEVDTLRKRNINEVETLRREKGEGCNPESDESSTPSLMSPHHHLLPLITDRHLLVTPEY